MDEENITALFSLAQEPIEGIKSTEAGPSDRIEFKLDYTLPVSKTDKFEAGLQSRTGNSGDYTEMYTLQATSNTYEIDNLYSRNTDYNRNIFGSYALYAGQNGSLGYQFGLRGEYTYREIVHDNTSYPIDRWDYFPTLHFSYSFLNDQQVMMSYSKRF